MIFLQSYRTFFKHRKDDLHSTIALLTLLVLLPPSHLIPADALSSHHTHFETDNFTHLLLNNELFVDKSLLIEEFLQHNGSFPAQTVVRPKGWGKSTNLNMLEKFFEIEVDENGDRLPAGKTINDKLFLGGTIQLNSTESKHLAPLKIAAIPKAIEHLGQHPVIMLRLGNISAECYERVEAQMKFTIVDVFRRHVYLRHSSKITEKWAFVRYSMGDFNSTELQSSLQFLASRLYEHFERDVVVLVDDYDVPIISAHREFKSNNETVDEADAVRVLRLLERLFAGARKRTIDHSAHALYSHLLHTTHSTHEIGSTANLNLALLTGVLDLSFEEIGAGGMLQFDRVHTLFDEPFSKFYGLTNEEVDHILAKVPFKVDAQELKNWYDGYPKEMKPLLYGPRTHFYNTRSVMRCLLGNSGTMRYYGDPIEPHGLLHDTIFADGIQELVQRLICGYTEWVGGYTYLTSEIRWERTQIAKVLECNDTIMAFNGLLAQCIISDASLYTVLAIPNNEMRHVFQTKQLQWVFEKFHTNRDEFSTFVSLLYTGLIQEFEESLQKYLSKASEFINSSPYSAGISYSGLMVAIRTILEDLKLIVRKSEYDGGVRNTTDIVFIPRQGHSKIAIVIRFTIVEQTQNLTQQAKIQLEQINELYKNGSEIQNQFSYVRKIIKLGIAFCAGKVEIEYENSVSSLDLLSRK